VATDPRGVEHYAERYADEFTSREELAAAARRRLAARLRHARTARCTVCGTALVGKPEGTLTCSVRCRVRKHRREGTE
jgi:hypothetical protein